MAEAGTAEFVTPDAPPRELSAGALLFVPPRREHLLRYGDEPFVGFSFKMEVRGIEDDGSPPLLIPPARVNAGCINAVRELLTATFPNIRLFNGENLLCNDDDYTLLVESLLLRTLPPLRSRRRRHPSAAAPPSSAAAAPAARAAALRRRTRPPLLLFARPPLRTDPPGVRRNRQDDDRPERASMAPPLPRILQ